MSEYNVPEGWTLVPVEPTREMLVAINWPNDPAGYRAMLAAAPAAPVVQAEQEPVGHELDGLAGDLLVAADLVRNKAVSSRLVEYSRHVAKLAYCTPAPDAVLVEALKELVSAVRSINRSGHHQIQLPADSEPVYWQRKEWIDWILGLADSADAALAGKGGE